MTKPRWTRRRRWLLTAACCWPIVYVVLFLVLRSTRLWFIDAGWNPGPAGMSARHWGAIALHAATLVECGVALIGCALHLATTERVVAEQRLPWLLLLLLAAPVALPAYAWLHVARPTAVERLRPPRPK